MYQDILSKNQIERSPRKLILIYYAVFSVGLFTMMIVSAVGLILLAIKIIPLSLHHRKVLGKSPYTPLWTGVLEDANRGQVNCK